MKVTASWSNKEEEGRLSRADVEALKLRASTDWGKRIHVLDFLKDAHFEIGKLYDEILTDANRLPVTKEAVLGDTPCHSPEHAKPETTPKGEQR